MSNGPVWNTNEFKINVDATGILAIFIAIFSLQGGCLRTTQLDKQQKLDACLKFSETPGSYSRCRKSIGGYFDDFPKEW